jgi:hypothetical protein
VSAWENNPLAVVLAGICGLLVLSGLAINLAWRGPVSSELNDADQGIDALPVLPPKVEELGAMSEYEVVNNRPLFSENRRPVVIDIEVAEEAPAEELEEEVAEPPRVRLTGVVITPTERVVTLTPQDGGEAVVIREGMPLDGEFVGWSVDAVDPREVSLRSVRGETVKVELAVYDSMMQAPAMPEPSLSEALERAVESAGVDDAAPSRADEIRERIRQRREELRAEAEQEAASQETQQAENKDAYRDAIRNMISNRKDKEETDDPNND